MKKFFSALLIVSLFFFHTTAWSLEQSTSNNEEYVVRSDKASRFIFSDLPKHLAYDLKDSVWGWGSLALALGSGLAVGLSKKDQSIKSNWDKNQVFGSKANQILGIAGAPYTWGAAGLAVAIAGSATHDEKLLSTGESLLETLFWTQSITLGLKAAVDRNRPDGSAWGFPSAHSSAGFGSAAVLQSFYGYKVGVPAYLFSTVVAFSRVDSYQHFVSDVVMGATIGSVLGYGTAKYHKKLHNNFSLTPQFSSGQYGLVLQSQF